MYYFPHDSEFLFILALYAAVAGFDGILPIVLSNDLQTLHLGLQDRKIKLVLFHKKYFYLQNFLMMFSLGFNHTEGEGI